MDCQSIKCLECFYYQTNFYYDVFDAVLDRMGESFFCKKTKTDVCRKRSWGRIVHLRSGKKDSVPFSKHFKIDQVFEISFVPL